VCSIFLNGAQVQSLQKGPRKDAMEVEEEENSKTAAQET
jgi:hypothetical protein